MLDEKPVQTNPTCIFDVGCKKMLDEKFVLKQISSNTIQHDFFLFCEMLDEMGAVKRIQHHIQHFKIRMLDEMLEPFDKALSCVKILFRNFPVKFFIYYQLVIVNT